MKAGQGVAAAAVLRAPDSGREYESTDDLSAVPARWIVFGGLQLVTAILAGASHLGARGGRLEPETGANLALVSTLITVALAFAALRLVQQMPAVMRSSRRTPLVVALVLLPIGLVLGLLRLAFGEAYEVDVMVRAAVVQAAGFVALFVLWWRTPGPAAVQGRAALSDAECARLRVDDPDAAQRMKDAEIQALLALTALGQIDMRLAEAESARIDERWGASGESFPSTGEAA